MKLTNKQITSYQKLNFWKDIGFEYIGSDYHEKWQFNGNEFDTLPPIDLNNLFKYAVPLAIEELRHYRGNILSSSSARDRLFRKWLCGYQDGILDEYALFWVIWEIIESPSGVEE